jgi:WD40 repeat protein
MKQYTGFPNEISCLAFSPDGRYLAIGSSYEHDNGVPQPEERTRIAVQIKTTVMDDCKVSSCRCQQGRWNGRVPGDGPLMKRSVVLLAAETQSIVRGFHEGMQAMVIS